MSGEKEWLSMDDLDDLLDDDDDEGFPPDHPDPDDECYAIY